MSRNIQLSHKWKSRKGLEKNVPISDSPTSDCGPLAVPTESVCRVLCPLLDWTQPALGHSSQWSLEMSSWFPFPFRSPLACCPNCPQALLSGEISVDLRTSAHSLDFLLVLIQIPLFQRDLPWLSKTYCFLLYTHFLFSAIFSSLACIYLICTYFSY